jgi:hypothetical protein
MLSSQLGQLLLFLCECYIVECMTPCNAVECKCDDRSAAVAILTTANSLIFRCHQQMTTRVHERSHVLLDLRMMHAVLWYIPATSRIHTTHRVIASSHTGSSFGGSSSASGIRHLQEQAQELRFTNHQHDEEAEHVWLQLLLLFF